MSYSKFSMALKSTLDYHAKQLADSRNLPFVDLAAEQFETNILESDQPAVCWDFTSFTADPRDPMYLVTFDIGVMTFLDPSQYLSLDLVSLFVDAFKVGTSIQIKDYTGLSMPTEILGSLYVVAVAVTPQHADKETGIRFVSVSARACRDG